MHQRVPALSQAVTNNGGTRLTTISFGESIIITRVALALGLILVALFSFWIADGSHGLTGHIRVTTATYERLQDYHDFEERGCIPVKSNGEVRTFLLTGRKVHYVTGRVNGPAAMATQV